MKPLLAILLALFTSFISYTQNNHLVTSNGKWNNNSTWALGHTPRNGETAIVPKDFTVIVDNNMTVSSDITIKVYGNLKFDVGKLKLSTNSVVLLYPGGTITSEQGNASDKIEIGGLSKYSGSQGTLDGPLMANAATTSFDFFPVSLPVRFIDYSISGFQNVILIKWTTADEENVLNYLIERSKNGSDWMVVGEVQPVTRPSSINYYFFRDASTLNGLLYYRVKQVDKSGESLYTSIKSIRAQPYNSLELTIVGVGENLVLSFPQQWNKKLVVSLLKLSGQLVVQQIYEQLNEKILFNKAGLKGHYILCISDGMQTKLSRQIFLD